MNRAPPPSRLDRIAREIISLAVVAAFFVWLLSVLSLIAPERMGFQ